MEDIAWNMGKIAPPTHLQQSQSYSNMELFPTATNRWLFGGLECHNSSSSLLRPHPWDCTREKEHRIAMLD